MQPFFRKILYVHYQRCETDGSFVHVREFARAFDRLCHRRGTAITVVGPKPINALPVLPRGLLGRIRAGVAKYYLRESKVVLRQGWRFWRERALLRREQPDIVLTRYSAETISIHWACRGLGIPVVTEFNGLDRSELAGTYRQFQVLNRLFSNCSVFRWSVGASGVSEPIAAALRHCNPLQKPILVNPNGVDVAAFDPALSCGHLREVLHLPPKGIVIGFVGSFMVWHDPDRLLRAFRKLLSAGIDAYLVLVGRRVPEIVRLVETAGPSCAARIRLPGFVPYAEIPSYVGLMDITVLPNTEEYCSPLKLFEYMAMAKPCVASASEPVRAILQDGQEGLLFEPRDEAALTSAILRLARDPALCRNLGQAARARVEREFTWEKNAERVMTLLEQAYTWHRRFTAAPTALRLF